MDGQDDDLVDIDLYDPGDGSLPAYRWTQAGRADLATRRQLRAMAARQTCPGPCGRRYFHCLPLKTLGSCAECADGTPADPASYTTPPATQPLAA